MYTTHTSGLTLQTLINRIGPVKQKMSSVEQEKRQAGREREESETNSREEVDSLRAKEQAIKENNQAIMRWGNIYSGLYAYNVDAHKHTQWYKGYILLVLSHKHK